jgi:hypothetical protein
MHHEVFKRWIKVDILAPPFLKGGKSGYFGSTFFKRWKKWKKVDILAPLHFEVLKGGYSI